MVRHRPLYNSDFTKAVTTSATSILAAGKVGQSGTSEAPLGRLPRRQLKGEHADLHEEAPQIRVGTVLLDKAAVIGLPVVLLGRASIGSHGRHR